MPRSFRLILRSITKRTSNFKERSEKVTNKLFSKFYKLLSVIAVTCIVSPAAYLFLYRTLPRGFIIPMYLIGFSFVAIGYGMQSFYGTVTSPRHDPRKDYYYDNGFESTESPFKPLKAALPLVIAALIGIFSVGISDKLLYFAYKTDIIATYATESAYPPVIAAFIFISVFLGIVLWFYPPHRIISMKSMLSYFGVILVIYAGSLMLSVPTNMLSVSLVVFFACSFIVLNQTFIQRGVTGTVTAISNNGRIYNIKLMIVAFAVVLFVLFIFAVVLMGVGFVLRFVIAYIASKMLISSGEEEDIYDVGDVKNKFSDVLFENQPLGDKFMIILCILLFIGAIVFFIFRGHAATKRLIENIKLWLREIFLFFMSLRDASFSKNEYSVDYSNYVDESIDLHEPQIRQYDPKVATKRSYKEFIAYLNSLDTATDQIRYVYITLLSVFREIGYGVKPAETPRETKNRVHARTAEHDITDVTNAIETVNYIESEPSGEESERTIRGVCRIIEKYFAS